MFKFFPETCPNLQALSSTNKSAIFFPSRFSVLIRFSHRPFILHSPAHLATFIILLYLSIMSTGHLFLTCNDAIDELVRPGALLSPSEALYSLLSTSIFSRAGGVLFYQSSLAYKSLSIHEQLVLSLIFSPYSLVVTAMVTAFF